MRNKNIFVIKPTSKNRVMTYIYNPKITLFQKPKNNKIEKNPKIKNHSIIIR